MNVFVLDADPKIAAQYHCDKHVVKMTTESLQIMSSVLWFSYGITQKKDLDYSLWQNFPRDSPYGIGFMNHPCTKWARASSENWDWLASLAAALFVEHERRWGRVPSARPRLEWFVKNKPSLPSIGLTPFVLAMPEDLKTGDPVHSYRMYYAGWKRYFATWKISAPFWWQEYCDLTRQKGLVSEKVKILMNASLA